MTWILANNGQINIYNNAPVDPLYFAGYDWTYILSINKGPGLQKNINISTDPSHPVYTDAVTYQWTINGVTYTTNFTGSGLNYDFMTNPNSDSGHVTGYSEMSSVNGAAPTFGMVYGNFDISLKDLHTLLSSTSASDHYLLGSMIFSGDDKIKGGQYNDVLQGFGGNDTIDGGGGVNTAVYSGNFADYKINTAGSGVYTISDSVVGRDGTDTLTNIQNLKFANGIVSLAALSDGPSPSVQQEIMGLYAALYGRAAEQSGYAFWVKSVGGGIATGDATTTPVSNSTATALGNGFVTAQSAYFDKTYGSLSDSQFIDAMYVNIGGAKPDPSGNAYWSGLLAKAEASGLSVQAARAGLVGTFVDALVEFNTATRPAGLTDQQWADALTRQSTINNKIEVSQGYANASNGPNGAILVPHAPDDAAYQAATRALQGVTSDHATVVTVLANISSAVQHQDLTLI